MADYTMWEREKKTSVLHNCVVGVRSSKYLEYGQRLGFIAVCKVMPVRKAADGAGGYALVMAINCARASW